MATDIPRPIQAKDITRAIRACGIALGQTAFVHSFLGAFGPIDGGLDDVLSGFREAIGERGTLILPTYNYAFCGGTPYDHATTPSIVGQMTEHFRKRKGVVRTLHPVYSHAVEGPKASEYAASPSSSSFGADSLFTKLKKDNAVFIFFGVSMQHATFEELLEVIRLYDLEDDIRIHRGLIEETLPPLLEEEKALSFSLVYIDTDLFFSTQLILRSLHPRLVKGGAFVLDEWNDPMYPGEGVAANEFLNEYSEFYEAEALPHTRQPSMVLRRIK